MTDLPMGRPGDEEYDSYYRPYVARVAEGGALAALETQGAQMIRLLKSLDDERARHRYAPGKWSIKEVIGHLLDTERVFAYRALSIARGERQSLPGFEQDDYVREGRFDGRTLESLARECGAVRQATLALFRSFDPELLRRSGIANGVPVSVRALVYITAGHEAHHLAILRERYLQDA